MFVVKSEQASEKCSWGKICCLQCTGLLRPLSKLGIEINAKSKIFLKMTFLESVYDVLSYGTT